MIPIAILGALSGAVLGLRFKVLILVPVIIGAAVISVAGGLVLDSDAWSIVLAVLVASGTLQIGFLAGTGLRFLLIAARFSLIREPAATAAASRSAR